MPEFTREDQDYLAELRSRVKVLEDEVEALKLSKADLKDIELVQKDIQSVKKDIDSVARCYSDHIAYHEKKDVKTFNWLGFAVACGQMVLAIGMIYLTYKLTLK